MKARVASAVLQKNEGYGWLIKVGLACVFVFIRNDRRKVHYVNYLFFQIPQYYTDDCYS